MRGGCVRQRGEQGTVLVLVIGFATLLALLVGVVVNVSAAALARRAVAGAADGAAVAAAQALDVDVLYRDGLAGDRLPLSPAGARQAVAAYGAQVAPTQPGLRLSVTVQGPTASVVAVREVPLPFGRLVGLRPLRVEATARARAPLSP